MHNSLAGVTSILLCNDFLLSVGEVKYDSMHWRWFSLKLFCWRREWVLFLSKEGFFGNSIITSNADDTFELLGWILGMAIKILCAGDQPSSTSSILLYICTEIHLTSKNGLIRLIFLYFMIIVSIKYILLSEMADIYYSYNNKVLSSSTVLCNL